MNPDEIKLSIRDAVNAMIKAEPEDQETAGELLRSVIRAKSAAIVSPAVVDEVDPAGEDAE